MSFLYTDQPPDLGYENWYDAAWYLIDSMAAGARNRENFQFSGIQLASGMERLLDGPKEHTIDPTDFGYAMEDLSAPSDSITLIGTMGLPTFDAQGGRDGDGSVFCVTPAAQYITDVLRLDGMGGLEGDTTACIPGF